MTDPFSNQRQIERKIHIYSDSTLMETNKTMVKPMRDQPSRIRQKLVPTNHYDKSKGKK